MNRRKRFKSLVLPPHTAGPGEAWLDPEVVHMNFVFLCLTAGIIYYDMMVLAVCVHLAFPLLGAERVWGLNHDPAL